MQGWCPGVAPTAAQSSRGVPFGDAGLPPLLHSPEEAHSLVSHCLVALGHAHLLHSPDHLAEVRGHTFGALPPGVLVLTLGHSRGCQHQEWLQSLQARYMVTQTPFKQVTSINFLWDEGNSTLQVSRYSSRDAGAKLASLSVASCTCAEPDRQGTLSYRNMGRGVPTAAEIILPLLPDMPRSTAWLLCKKWLGCFARSGLAALQEVERTFPAWARLTI